MTDNERRELLEDLLRKFVSSEPSSQCRFDQGSCHKHPVNESGCLVQRAIDTLQEIEDRLGEKGDMLKCHVGEINQAIANRTKNTKIDGMRIEATDGKLFLINGEHKSLMCEYARKGNVYRMIGNAFPASSRCQYFTVNQIITGFVEHGVNRILLALSGGLAGQGFRIQSDN